MAKKKRRIEDAAPVIKAIDAMRRSLLRELVAAIPQGSVSRMIKVACAKAEGGDVKSMRFLYSVLRDQGTVVVYL